MGHFVAGLAVFQQAVLVLEFTQIDFDAVKSTDACGLKRVCQFQKHLRRGINGKHIWISTGDAQAKNYQPSKNPLSTPCYPLSYLRTGTGS